MHAPLPQALDGVNTILALMNNAMQMLGMIGLLVESFRLQSVRQLLRGSSGRLASAFSRSFQSFRKSLPRMVTSRCCRECDDCLISPTESFIPKHINHQYCLTPSAAF